MDTTEKRLQELEEAVRSITQVTAGLIKTVESLVKTSDHTFDAIRLLAKGHGVDWDSATDGAIHAPLDSYLRDVSYYDDEGTPRGSSDAY